MTSSGVRATLSTGAAAADLGELRAQVTPENVLHVRNVLAAEAQYLNYQVALHGDQVHVGEPGKDPVSAPAAAGFNAKIQAMVTSIKDYISVLHAMAAEFEQTAKAYGHTEAQITDSFSKFYPAYQASADRIPATPARPPLMTPPPGSPIGQLMQAYPPHAPGDLRPFQPPPNAPSWGGGPR